MNRSVKSLFVFLILILTVSGAFAAEKKNKPETQLVDNYVAIFDFEITAGEKSISRPLADKVIHEFSQSDKYEVIDRGNMNKILKEQKFQMSGCVAQECKVEAGQLLGVGKIVNGSVGMVGKVYYLTLQLIDVKTGRVELSAEDECRCELEELLDSTKRLAKRLLGEKVDDSAEVAAKARAEAEDKAKAEQATKAKAEAEAAARAKAAGPEQKISNSIGMTFVYIKPGTFMMGSPLNEEGRDNDETQHQVTLTKGFYMGETEVTVGQWRGFARDSGYRTEAETRGGASIWTGTWEKKEGMYWDNPGFSQSDNHPVTCVSWNDAQAFIRWINRKEGVNYRLPTEAEWEYGARAGTTTARYWDGDPDQACGYANVSAQTAKQKWAGLPIHNCNDGYVETAPVRNYKPNSFGLYDMIGNVWEWCEDWKGDYPSGSVTDPTGPASGSDRVFRGGGWLGYPWSWRSANRVNVTPDHRLSHLGFRLSRTN
ncbi:MAG: SUMF1/EgtB/PvdO family nonheme iron enzyme [Desulfobacterales bacterium]